jgi:hypothetical protein
MKADGHALECCSELGLWLSVSRKSLAQLGG